MDMADRGNVGELESIPKHAFLSQAYMEVYIGHLAIRVSQRRYPLYRSLRHELLSYFRDLLASEILGPAVARGLHHGLKTLCIG